MSLEFLPRKGSYTDKLKKHRKEDKTMCIEYDVVFMIMLGSNLVRLVILMLV